MIIIGDNFFDGLQVVFGTMLVWSEVSPRRRTRPLGRARTGPSCRGPSHPPRNGRSPVGGYGAPRPTPTRGFRPDAGGPCYTGTISAHVTRSRFKGTYGGNFHMNDALWPFLQTKTRDRLQIFSLKSAGPCLLG